MYLVRWEQLTIRASCICCSAFCLILAPRSWDEYSKAPHSHDNTYNLHTLFFYPLETNFLQFLSSPKTNFFVFCRVDLLITGYSLICRRLLIFKNLTVNFQSRPIQELFNPPIMPYEQEGRNVSDQYIN